MTDTKPRRPRPMPLLPHVYDGLWAKYGPALTVAQMEAEEAAAATAELLP